jgi:DNA topoisomerase-1
MSYTLLIVESPAKCGKIEKYLGTGYKVLGSFGHITHLSNLKQIEFENNYKPNFEIAESKKSQVSKLKQAISKAKEVILATDDDREGEAIAWHITQVFNLCPTTTKRIIFHEITERAIKNALENPGVINLNLVYAQQGRQILDLIVGFKLSPILWKHIVSNTKNSLSAGRCQTPALRLVYENYKEIQESPGKLSFNTTGIFTSKNIIFTLNHNHNSHDEIKKFLELSKSHEHILSKEKERETKKNQPSPFTTSGLQQAANNNMHISPKDTMALAQKLYEGGYITYMRTDSKVYSEEFIEKGIIYITENYNKEYINPNMDIITQSLNKEEKVDNKKKSKKKKEENNNAQEAHEAIRPTNINTVSLPQDEDVFTARHRKLYKLIWNNTLESMMAPAIYNQLVVKVSAPENHNYKYSAEENIFAGWKAVQGVEEDKNYSYLKNIKEGLIVPKKIISKQTLKDLKSHYTEARLVQLLEQKGIGRPSTFSSLIDKIQERDYVKKQNVEGKKLEIIDYTLEDNNIKEERGSKEFGNEKNKLVITQVGILVIEFLIKYFNNLFEYGYTKTMEDDLDLIARGLKEYHVLCDDCNKFIDDLVTTNSLLNNSSISSVEKLKIKIDDKHTYLIGKNGPTIKFLKDDGSAGFYGVKPEIDLEKLKNGEYKLDDIIVLKEDNTKNLGIHNGLPVYLKVGKFGYYLECGELRKSLKSVKINVPFKNIQLDDAISILEDASQIDTSILRKIDDNLCIRNGKYGPYIFYKTPRMKKPQFMKLAGFDDNFKTCKIEYLRAWIKEKYTI